MRKIFLVAILAILASCESDTKGYKISGTVQNAQDGQKVIVHELNESNTQAVPVDTAIIKDGRFELDLPKKDKPTISFLGLEGVRGNVLYIANNEPVTFEIFPDSLYISKREGGKDNEILNTYLADIKTTNERMGAARASMQEAFNSQDTKTLESLQSTQEQLFNEDKANKKQIIEKNPGSIVSVMIMQDMMNSQAFTASEMTQLYEGLDSNIKETSLAQMLKANLDQMSKTDIGNQAPNFSAPTPEGKELALKDALGKVTLVDFWAAWCRPCRIENPNIVEVYNQYHDKGFNVIQVSLDRSDQKDKWIQAIKDDKLEQWDHVSHLMFWQDPIAAEYGVRAIPAAFLLDEEGKIIAKDLRGPALGEKLEELLGDASGK